MDGENSQKVAVAKPKLRKIFTLSEEDKIIEFYSQNDHLWDPKHPDYKIGVKSLTIQTLVQDLDNKFTGKDFHLDDNTLSVHDLFSSNLYFRIVNNFVLVSLLTAAEIHHRFSGMRTTYRTNANKVASSKTTGADGGQVYIPTWPHYDSMRFLDASKPTRQSVTSFTVKTVDEISTDDDPLVTEVNAESATEASQSESNQLSSESGKSGKVSKQSKQTPSKRKRNSDSDDVVVECLNILRSVNKENDPAPVVAKEPLDRCAVFGEFVTASLKNMSQWSRTLAMGEISNVLVKYDPNNPNEV